MRNDAFRSPLMTATNSATLSGLNSIRNQLRASRNTGSRRSSKSCRFSDALSNGVGISQAPDNKRYGRQKHKPGVKVSRGRGVREVREVREVQEVRGGLIASRRL